MNQLGGCNTHVHGNNTRNLPVELSLSLTSENAMFFLLSFMVFFPTKSENRRAEQVLPGGRGGGTNVFACK
jgi:hypothetical protein